MSTKNPPGPRVVRWLYRVLPILCLCHCRPERSFFFRGRQFPVCARCTGVLAGMALAPLLLWVGRPPVWALALLLLPMVIDGVAQQRTAYESINRRRLWTGLLFGYAALTLFFLSVAAVWSLGRRAGAHLFSPK